MAKTILQSYLNNVGKELSPDRKLPKITFEQINYNLEMMPADDEDAARMFLAGIITNLELISILTGKSVLI